MKRYWLCFLFTSILVIFLANPIYAFDLKNPLKSFSQKILSNKRENTENSINQKNSLEQKRILAEKRNIIYSGYSKSFKLVKKLIALGKIEEVIQLYKENDNKNISGIDTREKKTLLNAETLANLEGAQIALSCGKYDDSITMFTKAEKIIKNNDNQTISKTFLDKVWATGGGMITGNSETGPYLTEGYEKVLMLNLKSIVYLLQGKREAYNVARRSIEWQKIEREKFDKKIKAVKEKLAEKEKEQKDKRGELGFNLKEILGKQYASMDTKADTLPSAFVNPFGYYISGIVQEFESFNDSSLRDNARISYEKALDLNPKNKFLKELVEELKKKSAPPNKRLVHVIVADGYVPEKKVLSFNISMKNADIPVKLPIYDPVPSKVNRINVYDEKGHQLSKFSKIADIEALCLRHQKDTAPIRTLSIFATIVRTYFEGSILDKFGQIGSTIKKKRNEMSTPDMRSWMSLPASIYAARFYAPQNLNRIQIVTYDLKGNKLASKSIELDKSSHNFVFARSIDDLLYVYSNEKMWIAMN
ncbi:MAG: hypothetical protein D6734_05895 [Candidatus Schekmanbacteria bacterium]|nr:MAG: hypothetical protein D6734_05895 [Candidatus Schekmanbacteria bacterium]